MILRLTKLRLWKVGERIEREVGEQTATSNNDSSENFGYGVR